MQIIQDELGWQNAWTQYHEMNRWTHHMYVVIRQTPKVMGRPATKQKYSKEEDRKTEGEFMYSILAVTALQAG